MPAQQGLKRSPSVKMLCYFGNKIKLLFITATPNTHNTERRLAQDVLDDALQKELYRIEHTLCLWLRPKRSHSQKIHTNGDRVKVGNSWSCFQTWPVSEGKALLHKLPGKALIV